MTKIADVAGQKGTGKWTAINALDLGMPVTLIGEAVFARCLSALRDERVSASKVLGGPPLEPFKGDKQQFIDDLEQALYASKIISYAQGFMLMREAAKEYNWTLNNAGIALMWRGGCIIRSVFLGDITKAFEKNAKLENLLFDDLCVRAVAAQLTAQLQQGHPQGPARMASHHRAGRAVGSADVRDRRFEPSDRPGPRSRPRWPSLTATAPSACRRACCKPSATTLAPTPSGSSRNSPRPSTPRARTSTSTGPVRWRRAGVADHRRTRRQRERVDLPRVDEQTLDCAIANRSIPRTS